jgi:hypothetical protein
VSAVFGTGASMECEDEGSPSLALGMVMTFFAFEECHESWRVRDLS